MSVEEAFVSLEAFVPENLSRLLLDSIRQRQNNPTNDEVCYDTAIQICFQSIEILRTQKKYKLLGNYATERVDDGGRQKSKESKAFKSESIQCSLLELSSDTMFNICSYLEVYEACAVRFSSRALHVSLMCCPLNVIDVVCRSRDMEEENEVVVHTNEENMTYDLIEGLAPLKLWKCLRLSSCNCIATRQLSLLDHEKTVLASSRLSRSSQLLQQQLQPQQQFPHPMTPHNLTTLGFNRSWSISALKFYDNDRFISKVRYLIQQDAYHSLKKLEIYMTDNNLNWINSTEEGRMFVKHIEEVELKEVERTVGVSINIQALLHFHALRKLEFSVNIDDLSVLASLPKLTALMTNNCVVADGGVDIEALTNLKKLSLIRTYGLRYINSSLSVMTQLEEFVLECCDDCYFKIASLSQMTHSLRKIDLTCSNSALSSQVSGNISSISSLERLERLYIDRCGVFGNIESLSRLSQSLMDLTLQFVPKIEGDIEFLSSHFVKLKSLLLEEVNFRGDISKLCSLKHLTSLMLFRLPKLKGSLHELSAMTQLDKLYLEKLSPNIVGDLSFLKTLTKLQHLSLRKCVSLYGDLKSLSDLKNLGWLNLEHCPKVHGRTSCIADILDRCATSAQKETGEYYFDGIYGENITIDH